MKYLPLIMLIFFFCSCTKPTIPSEPADSQALKDSPNPSRDKDGFFHQGLPPSLKLPNAPPTARDIDRFKHITATMSMEDVVRICGVPDQETGSGIHIFIYKLDDSSEIWIGTGDLKKLLYIKRRFSDGRSEDMLKK